MLFWLVNVGEVLPIDPGQERLLRMGVLAEALRARGHEVLWWTSTFDHVRKRHRSGSDCAAVTRSGIRLRLLHSVSYPRNVSLRRIANHVGLASKFARLAESEPAPDLVLCSWPTIELAWTCVRYGSGKGVPVVVDVRDLWPDIFGDCVPAWLRWLVPAALLPFRIAARTTFSGCTSIIGISEKYLSWALGYAGRPRGECDRVFPLGYPKATLSLETHHGARWALERLGVDGSRTICWFIGTFGETYDLSPVLRAARRFESRGDRRIQFVLSGDGRMRGAWEQEAHGLNNVVFTGWINAQQIGAMMDLAAIGLAAYRRGAPQGLGNKVFEYMAAGIPILSSLPGECEEFLARHQCGLSYRAGDADGLENWLALLLGDPALRRQMGERGRRAFEQSYSAETVYSSMAVFLEALVGSRCRHVGPDLSGSDCDNNQLSLLSTGGNR